MANDFYPSFVPQGLNGVTAIAASPDFCFAVTTNISVAIEFEHKDVQH